MLKLGDGWRLAREPNETWLDTVMTYHFVQSMSPSLIHHFADMVLTMTKSKCFKRCLSDTLPLPQ
jgi:hypothetical protein